ncbi:MAG: GNAT family N-acetyltransferase [Candidatus Gracilibacteria bacterium]|jgi:ribosomal-protein-alanine N-acetyltransferase
MNNANLRMKIRKMRISDIPSIGKIIQQSLSNTDAKKAEKDLMDQSKKLYVEGENFVAEINNKVVGVIGYWRLGHHPKKVVWLDWFAVNEEYQRRGIGSKLLLYMINKLSKKKFQMLCCEKSGEGLSSKLFYAKHKFVEFGKIKNYWENNGDLILLVKYL